MKPNVASDDPRVIAVVEKAKRYDLRPEVHAEKGTDTTAVEIYLKNGKATASSLPQYIFENMDGVSRVVRVSVARVSAYMNGDRDRHTIKIGNAAIGPNQPCLLVSGNCAIDASISTMVEKLAEHEVLHQRACARKPRSSAEGFRGLGAVGWQKFLDAARGNGVESVWTEVIESCDVDEVRRIRDKTGYNGQIVLWVGARNLGNYRLLEKLGQSHEFVAMIKNGLHMTAVEQLIDLAGFILFGPMWWNEDGTLDEKRSSQAGNNKLIFCVRGLAKYDQYDLSRFYSNHTWIREIHERSWAPVCFDPSHIGGRVDFVFDTLAAGLKYRPDVVMVESHACPDKALCDRDQAVPLERIPELIAMVDAHNQAICPAAV